MSYVNSIARLEREEGEQTEWLEGSIATALEFRFGEPGRAFICDVNKIKDLNRLNSILAATRQAASLEESSMSFTTPDPLSTDKVPKIEPTLVVSVS